VDYHEDDDDHDGDQDADQRDLNEALSPFGSATDHRFLPLDGDRPVGMTMPMAKPWSLDGCGRAQQFPSQVITGALMHAP
jgi:hypothetical protein